MTRYKSFFHFQHTALGILWRWGMGSVLAGLVASFSRNTVVRHAGIQALAWGAIDATLAHLGRHQARQRISEGMPDQGRHARRFRTIVLVNAGLDVGYVTAGWLLIRRSTRPERVGIGLGIVVQGLFLLVLDSLLALRTGQWIDRDAS